MTFWPAIDIAMRVIIFYLLILKKNHFNDQIAYWKDYFQKPEANRGLSGALIVDQEELRQLTSFFSWAAWATAANVPGKNYSYTNNFPYEPLIGNGPSRAALLWSALSLINLLAGIALILFFFGRFNYLGWREEKICKLQKWYRGNQQEPNAPQLNFLLLQSCSFCSKHLQVVQWLTILLILRDFSDLICHPYCHRTFFVHGICSLLSFGLPQPILAEEYLFLRYYRNANQKVRWL